MKILLTGLLLLLTSYLHAQDYTQPFDRKNFPRDKFQVNYKPYSFKGLLIEFVTVKEREPVSDSATCYIYLNIYKNTELLNAKSLGANNSTGTFGVPDTQATDKYFMFTYSGEWNGEITLIDASGKLITFPGYYWAITQDRKFIVTKAIYPDSELPATKFTIATGKFITKIWHLTKNGEPWNEVQSADYKSLETSLCK